MQDPIRGLNIKPEDDEFLHREDRDLRALEGVEYSQPGSAVAVGCRGSGETELQDYEGGVPDEAVCEDHGEDAVANSPVFDDDVQA